MENKVLSQSKCKLYLQILKNNVQYLNLISEQLFICPFSLNEFDYDQQQVCCDQTDASKHRNKIKIHFN
jgi:hypothetical protein